MKQWLADLRLERAEALAGCDSDPKPEPTAEGTTS